MAASFRAHLFQHPAYPETADRADRDAGDVVLTLGAIATGELLRMTAPRATGRAFAEGARGIRPKSSCCSAGTGACAGDRARASRGGPRSCGSCFEPMIYEPHADVPLTDTAAEIGEIEQVADVLGPQAPLRKVTVLGTARATALC